MRTRFFLKALAPLAFLLLTACGSGNDNSEAEKMLQQAKEQYEKGLYLDAKTTIDSLRKMYPKAIEVRKKALQFYQQAELERAQKEVVTVDSLLNDSKLKYEEMKAEVEALKAEGKATAEQLTALTHAKLHCDSLQTQFDVLCAKIRYIRMKQKE